MAKSAIKKITGSECILTYHTFNKGKYSPCMYLRTSLGEFFIIIYIKKPFKNCNNTVRNLIMEEW